MTQAITAVATASRLRRSDAALAKVIKSPSSRRAGAMIPPAQVAPRSQGRSLRESGLSVELRPVAVNIMCKKASPMPEPK
jgi:hypothetical protein